MLSGATFSASEMAGTAVLRIVVSSDSMKKATATSHGKRRLLEAVGAAGTEGDLPELVDLGGLGGMESSHHSTSEPQDLLEGTTTMQILLSFPFDYFCRAFGSPCS
jgi:hypothetical protein